MRKELIRFSKYHGCGNSFVITDESKLPSSFEEEDMSRLAEEICCINTGVGADGFIVVRQEPELEMVFFNMDGSRAPMCGNGIRCFAHYCRDNDIMTGRSYPVRTLAGTMNVEVVGEDPFSVRINMGKPVFSGEAITSDIPDNELTNVSIGLCDGSMIEAVSMFMGTVHTVVTVDELEDETVENTGREICNHPLFREKTNVNFVKPIDDKTIAVRTYERGVGVTLACGTGACASVIAAGLRGLCGREVSVELPLGRLMISLADDGSVYMEGPSVKVADGEFYRERKESII